MDVADASVLGAFETDLLQPRRARIRGQSCGRAVVRASVRRHTADTARSASASRYRTGKPDRGGREWGRRAEFTRRYCHSRAGAPADHRPSATSTDSGCSAGGYPCRSAIPAEGLARAAARRDTEGANTAETGTCREIGDAPHPEGRCYTFLGTGTLQPLISGVVPQSVASPAGFEPAFWP